MTDFQRFCQQATDDQLAEILAKEWAASHAKGKGVSPGVEARKADYKDAEMVAARRGWFVKAGRRLA